MGNEVHDATVLALGQVKGKTVASAGMSHCWGPKQWDTTLISLKFTDGTCLEIGSDGMVLGKDYLWVDWASEEN